MAGLASVVCCPQWGFLEPVGTALSTTTPRSARHEYLEEFIDIHGTNLGLRHKGRIVAMALQYYPARAIQLHHR